MARARGDAPPDSAPDCRRERPIIEKRHVLLPGQAHHHLEPILERDIEQPVRRDRVGPDRVYSVLRHLSEVIPDSLKWRIAGSICAYGEGSIGGPADVLLLVPAIYELSVCPRPQVGGPVPLGP